MTSTFSARPLPATAIEAFFSEPDEIASRPELLYATMTVRDQTYKYYRFQTPDDNMVDFYDENGRSTRKFLLRKPIAEGRDDLVVSACATIRSCISPACILASIGAAPIGTPIYAAGNGVIIKAQWDSGYGRRVEIQHANGYVTTYNHMSGFGRGVTEGARVTQGQVIGYLGQSGLATGPHLHYEVIINGNFVDPMAIKLARTREFDGKMLALFKRERDRVDAADGAGPLGRRDGRREADFRPRGNNRQAQLSATPRPPRSPAPNPSAARIAAGETPLARSSASDGDRRRFASFAPAGSSTSRWWR